MDQILDSIGRMIAESASAGGHSGQDDRASGVPADAADAGTPGRGSDMRDRAGRFVPQDGDTDAGGLAGIDFTDAIEEARAKLEEAAATLPLSGTGREPAYLAYGGALERPLWPSERGLRGSTSSPSRQTETAVTGAFEELSAFLANRTGRTVDELVADLLRPLVKDWLDDNLPGLAERLVREEIARLARGNR